MLTTAVSGNLLTLDFLPDSYGTTIVTVTAASNGKTIDATMTVTVSAVDDPPVVANAIADINASEDDPVALINLSSTFNDVDDDNASISKTAASSDDSLLTATLSGDILTLNYQTDRYGVAVVTLTATSGR